MGKDNDSINYGELIDDAMHVIVKRALEKVAKDGLPGEHHFFISFLTQYPGVKISKDLIEKYPEEMTIVLQYQFSDLYVDDNGMGISLSFDNIKESLYIPFMSLTAFADPSVKFGLQFRHMVDEDEDGYQDGVSIDIEGVESDSQSGSEKKSDKHPDNVVTLDSFRKK